MVVSGLFFVSYPTRINSPHLWGMLISGEISISAAIDQMRNSHQAFILQFVVGNGRNKGRLKTVRAIYGASTREVTDEPAREKATTLHKEDGTFPLCNADNQSEYLTPYISHLRIINGYTIKH